MMDEKRNTKYWLMALVIALTIMLNGSLFTTQAQGDQATKDIEKFLYHMLPNHINEIQSLIKLGADVNTTKDNGETLLIRASKNGYPEIVKLLLEANADVNWARHDGATALDMAASRNRPEIVKLLLKANADVNNTQSNNKGDGATPLLLASQEGHLEIVKLLLEANADVNKAADNGTTPLFMASYTDQLTIVELLLENKAEVNSAAFDGSTPLLIASQRGYPEIVKLLLEANSDVNVKNNNGATSLYVASQNGNTEIVELLLKTKADINIRNNNGVTPAEVASQNGYTEIAMLLTNSGSSPQQKASADRIFTEDVIRFVQKKLKILGYAPGPADGKIGTNTENAIRSFQKSNGFASNGFINESLIEALDKVTGEILVLDRAGKERERIDCRKGESAFVGEIFVPCGATLIQDPGELKGVIKY